MTSIPKVCRMLTRSICLAVIILPTILLGAGSVQAKAFFCSVDTVCSGQLPCYANEYVWDMQIVPTNEGWVFTYEPDDGSRDVYREIEGVGGDGKALFLMRILSDDNSGQVTLFTIRQDLRLAISNHFTEDSTTAETAFGTCEVVE